MFRSFGLLSKKTRKQARSLVGNRYVRQIILALLHETPELGRNVEALVIQCFSMPDQIWISINPVNYAMLNMLILKRDFFSQIPHGLRSG